MKNWWAVKPAEINDFQEICTVFWHMWSAIGKACKNAFVRCSAVCLCTRVHPYVCSYPTVWMEETSPEGYPFSLITLMKLVEREGQGAFLLERSECFRLWEAASPPVKHPGSFLHQTAGQRDMIFSARQLYLTQTAPSKQQHDCVLSYLLVWRGYGIFFFPFIYLFFDACVSVRVCVRISSR